MASFFSEFRRRNVFKISVAYLVVAWLIIQVADVLAPQLNLPDWAPRLVTFIVLLGFPLALVLAWIFEVTPAGIRAEPGTKPDKTLFVIAGVLAAIAMGWFFWGGLPSPPATGERSIAVLPFVNISDTPGNEYFSDGISEELLNALSNMPALRVASRTSSFSFKDQQMEIREIAEELNVALVLEGSVRRQSDRVRITAQLIDAASGFHLWSESYDRSLKDIFATQDEIALAIANALELELEQRTQADRNAREIDPELYDRYLRARSLFPVRGETALREAAEILEEVLIADSQFAEAHAVLGLVYAVLPFYTTEDRIHAHAIARDAAEHALALNPELPEAYGALGDIAIHSMNYELAEALLKRSLEQSPSFVAGYYWLAENYLYIGKLEQALQALESAAKLDPLSRTSAYMRALTKLAMEQPEIAREDCRNVLAADPANDGCRMVMLVIELGERNFNAVQDLLLNSPKVNDEVSRELAESVIDALKGGENRADIAQQLLEMPYHAAFDPTHPAAIPDAALPALFLALDETELAIQRFILNASNEPKDVMDVIWDPSLDRIRCDPSFQSTVRDLNITDWRAKRVCP